jgi:hypothetical protein
MYECRRLVTLLFISMLATVSSGCAEGDGQGASSPEVQLETSGDSDQCVVTIAYGGNARVDAIDLTFDYSEVDGDFGEAQYGTRCRSVAKGVTRTTAFNRCDDTCAAGEHRELYLSLSIGQPLDDTVLETPADLFECLFRGDSATLAGLDSQLLMWGSNFETLAIDAPLTLDVSCDGWPDSTTTTSITTTTFSCQNEECSGEIVPVGLRLDDAVSVGSLQVDVEVPAEVGAFEQFATTAALRCRLADGINALYANNQVPRFDDASCDGCTRRATFGFVFPGAGLTGPADLITCDFVVGSRLPELADLPVTIADASSPTLEPMVPPPSVSVVLPSLESR